jgi:hypothetical protein
MLGLGNSIDERSRGRVPYAAPQGHAVGVELHAELKINDL